MGVMSEIPSGPSAAELMIFGIKCPRCGKYTHKMVAWLTSHESLPCSSPGCGDIDLKEPDQRALIEKLTDQMAELRPFLVQSTKRN
jgi:endogenous inhibitor of DNA gyrase (YacG/DUF329 family)